MFTDLAVVFASAILILLLVLSFVQRFSASVSPVVPWAGGTLLLAFIAQNRIAHFLRSYRRGVDPGGLPYQADDRYRVQVACWPDQVDQLRLIGPAGFDPEQFRAFLSDARFLDPTLPVNFGWPWGVVYLLVQLSITTDSIWLLGLAITLVGVPALWLHRLPTYVRFTPGRLEILRYPFLGSRNPRRQEFSLRGPVRISTRGAGSIRWTDEDGRGRILSLLFLADRAEARRAALAAALSQASVPAPEE